jgi:PIN domain nuclease of toxin-antitoxin system
MKLLLDTHTLIWFLNGDEKLSGKVKSAIEDVANEKFVSVASVWEIAIKISLDKFRFSMGFKNFLTLIEENGFGIVPITMEHALVLSTLEFIHRDPFDRLLVSQCKADDLTLATIDENIKKYHIKTIW